MDKVQQGQHVVMEEHTSSLVNIWTKCGKASMRWWWIRQQYPQPASAASRAGRKSAKALVRASSLAMQNRSRVCTRDAITCTLTALLSSPNRFRKGLQAENQDVSFGFTAPGSLRLCARSRVCLVIHPHALHCWHHPASQATVWWGEYT